MFTSCQKKNDSTTGSNDPKRNLSFNEALFLVSSPKIERPSQYYNYSNKDKHARVEHSNIKDQISTQNIMANAAYEEIKARYLKKSANNLVANLVAQLFSKEEDFLLKKQEFISSLKQFDVKILENQKFAYGI